MNVERTNRLPVGWATLLAFIASLAFLHFGRPILLPLALAALVSLLLSPLVSYAERVWLRRIPAVILITGAVLVALGWMGWVMVGQLANLAERLPLYRENIHRKIEAFQGSTGGLVGRAFESIRGLHHEVSRGAPFSEKSDFPPVELVAPTLSPLEVAGSVLSTTFTSLATGAVVVLLVILILIYQSDLRDRLSHLAGATRVHVTMRMVEEAASHTSRYLLLQTIINAGYGAAFALGMLALGIPNAFLWGVLGFLLRYLPYLGPILATMAPLVLSAAVFDGWGRPLMAAVYLTALELVIGNAVEPWVYGKGTGLSPVAVVVSAMFWTSIWGVPGLILAVPITSTLATLGRHVRPLRFLNVLLGSEPNLESEFRLYHRLLVGDVEAALALIDDFGKGRTLEQIYDELLVPALALAEQNRHLDGLEDSWNPIFLEGMRSIIEAMDDRYSSSAVRESKIDLVPQTSVLLVPVADEADEFCARMLGHLLKIQGIPSRMLEVSCTTGDKADQVERINPDILFLSAIPPSAILQTRYLFKRIRSRRTTGDILVGLWSIKDDPVTVSPRVSTEEGFRVRVTLAEASSEIRERAMAIHLVAQASSSAGTAREA
jgi:predicted PurR-regulated permease PerM